MRTSLTSPFCLNAVSRTCAFSIVAVLLLGSNLSAAPQDLGRNSDLVNQALRLADTARASRQGMSMSATGQQARWTNPFSSTTVGATHSTPGASGVEISGSNIRVNAGGLQMDIPRTGNVAYPPVSPMVGVASRNPLQTAQHWRNFADAVNSFHGGQFDQATSLMRQVSPSPQAFPAFNHFHSLCTFAEGNYDQSAEYAYAGLAQSQPLYSWDQIRGYYEDPTIYTQQYHALQAEAAAPNANVSTQFLLGYHHLMLGHREHASQVLENVLTQLPNDPVIQQTLTFSRQLPPTPRQ